VIRAIISVSVTGQRQRYSIDVDMCRIVGHAAIGVNVDLTGGCVTLLGQEANYQCEPDATNVAELAAVTPGAAGTRAG